ncbi:MAG TPA: aminotransferase class V-fold PLP-dependent enzyme [Gemmatimonadaceae bacterium]|nr:aminotransferase class V-fold PLP-dependent enzyme [Gemmatimonadaceae bacterium]
MGLTRRDFARLLAIGSSSTLIPRLGTALERPASRPPFQPAGASPTEGYWDDVRQQFLMPEDRIHINAANLCPAPRPVFESQERWSRMMDADPSAAIKAKLSDAREESRKLLAEFLGATPEEIVITRNTSEANNLVSSGVTLGPNDEIVLYSDNHPSNLIAWREKAKRYGFHINVVANVSPHPGGDYYIDAFRKALTPRTKLLAFTHVTNSVGDMLPAKELCAMARERGILSLVDGAQSFGVLAVSMAEMQPDFYSGSLHKWPCGPKETGLLYIRRDVQDRLTPSVASLYAGRVGASRTLEAMGQRDEPALAAVGDAVRFQSTIGRKQVEQRARELAQMLMTELAKLPGVIVWTSRDPSRSAGVVTFKPANLDTRRLASALYDRDKISCSARAGEDRPGIRFAPHVYNPISEVERVVAVVKGYLANGV